MILEVSVWLSLNTRQTSTAHKTFNNIIMHNTQVRGCSVCVCVKEGEGKRELELGASCENNVAYPQAWMKGKKEGQSKREL